MRRITFTPVFDRELEDIAFYVNERFGEAARRDLLADLATTCVRIAEVPHIGTIRHGYDTASAGLVFRQNWIFFEYDDYEVRLLRIVNSRRNKPDISL